MPDAHLCQAGQAAHCCLFWRSTLHGLKPLPLLATHAAASPGMQSFYFAHYQPPNAFIWMWGEHCFSTATWLGRCLAARWHNLRGCSDGSASGSARSCLHSWHAEKLLLKVGATAPAGRLP